MKSPKRQKPSTRQHCDTLHNTIILIFTTLQNLKLYLHCIVERKTIFVLKWELGTLKFSQYHILILCFFKVHFKILSSDLHSVLQCVLIPSSFLTKILYEFINFTSVLYAMFNSDS